MLNLSYEYKLKPTDEQISEIERTLVICRKVWNYALRERKDWINSRKCPINACSIVSEYIIPADETYPNYFVQAAGLTKAKEIYPELKTVNAQMLQQVLRKKDWQFKLAHEIVLDAGMVFVEDIDFRVWAKGMFCKHTLDASFGQFISILSWVCWKQGVYFEKVNKDYTSQVCPNCDTHTGKKILDNRVHNCPECGYTTHRDVAAAQVIRNRGLSAEGRSVDIKEIACGGGLTGTGNSLVKSQRDKKKKA
jgi:transposase